MREAMGHRGPTWRPGASPATAGEPPSGLPGFARRITRPALRGVTHPRVDLASLSCGRARDRTLLHGTDLPLSAAHPTPPLGAGVGLGGV